MPRPRAGLLPAACLVLLTLPPVQAAPAGGTAPRPGAEPPADLHGDPLPPGALARLGSVRFWCGSPVEAVALSPDGKTLASGHTDGAVRLWDSATGQEVGRLTGHQDAVRSVAFSPDGKVLASRSGHFLLHRDNSIRLWEVATGKELRQFGASARPLPAPTSYQGSMNWAFAVAFSPDGKALASGPGEVPGTDGAVRLWDVATGQELLRFQGHQGPVHSFAFSPDGKTLATGGLDKTVRLWEVATGKELRRLAGHQDGVGAVAFSPDGKTLATAARDHTVRLWSLATGNEVRQFQAGLVGAVAFSPDGRYLAWGNTALHLWDTLAGRELPDFPERTTLHRFGISSLAFAADGGAVAATGVSPDDLIHLWEVPTGKQLAPRFPGHQDAVIQVAFSPDGKTVASGGSDLTARVWDARTGAELRRIEGERAGPIAVAFSPDGKTLALKEGIRLIRLVDPSTGRELRRVRVERDNLLSMAFSPDGKTLAAARSTLDETTKSWAGTVCLWDVATGQERRPFVADRGTVDCVAFSPDGKLLASAGVNRGISLWDTVTGKLVRDLQGETGFIRSLAFSPGGKTLASAGVWAQLWDVGTGQELRPRERMTPPTIASTAAFSPDGRTLAVGGVDHRVYLFEVATGRERRRFLGHHDMVSSLAFSPDGKALASGSNDAMVLVWDVVGLLPAERPAALSPADLDGLWTDLASTDAAQADRALRTLVNFPGPGVRLLEARLTGRGGEADKRRLARLIADLDDDAFEVRERASRELAALGSAAEPALRKALEGEPSPEVRRRVERLLQPPGPGLADPHARLLRAVEALEHIGSPEARQVLEALTREAADAAVAEEAKASLSRLAKTNADPPQRDR